MKCAEVLEKYHRIVPFPLSIKRIKAAGYDPAKYLKRMAKDIRRCDDIENDKTAQDFLRKVAAL